MELYNACRGDEPLLDVSEIEFSSTFSDLRCVKTSLSFISFLDGKGFTSNPYLSEFSGQIRFELSNYGIIADLYISLSEQFSNPEDAYEVFNKYDYIKGDDLYKRKLDNTQAGKFEITGKNHFNFSRMDITDISIMIKLSKATILEMHKYLSDLEWIESLA